MLKNMNCVEEIKLSNEDIKALDLMENFLSAGAGALITCKCEITEKKDEGDDGK